MIARTYTKYLTDSKKAVDSLVDNIISKFVCTLTAEDMYSLSEELLLDITPPTKVILPAVSEDGGAAAPDDAGPALADDGMNGMFVTRPGDVADAMEYDTFG